MIKVLFIISHGEADKNGKRGVNGPEKRSLKMMKYWEL